MWHGDVGEATALGCLREPPVESSSQHPHGHATRRAVGHGDCVREIDALEYIEPIIHTDTLKA